MVKRTSYSDKAWMSYQTFFNRFIKYKIVNSFIHFIYSPILLLFINLCAILYYIFKAKNMNKFVVSSFGIIEAIMIFTVGTASIYMFIYPIWLISFFVAIIFINDFFKRRKTKK